LRTNHADARIPSAFCFTPHTPALEPNENGWTNAIWRCAIIHAAMLRFGDIHHCVPATPPNRILLTRRMIERRGLQDQPAGEPCALPGCGSIRAKRIHGLGQLIGHHLRNRLRLEQGLAAGQQASDQRDHIRHR